MMVLMWLMIDWFCCWAALNPDVLLIDLSPFVITHVFITPPSVCSPSSKDKQPCHWTQTHLFSRSETFSCIENLLFKLLGGFKLGYSVFGKSHHPMDISQTQNIEAEMAARTSERLCWTHCVCRWALTNIRDFFIFIRFPNLLISKPRETCLQINS